MAFWLVWFVGGWVSLFECFYSGIGLIAVVVLCFRCFGGWLRCCVASVTMVCLIAGIVAG